VQAAAARYVVRGADSFSLGEPVKLVAFPGDHTPFEDPRLAQGRRVRSDAEAEVGVGLAQALGLRVGGALAVALPDGGEARFRVVGVVRALDDDGRLAYVRPGRLLAASPGLRGEIVVRLAPGADGVAVRARLAELGAQPSAVGGATTRNGAFLGVLASLLRAVAAIDALVCLYALVQALALTARERRPTLSVLRAAGAGTGTVAAVLAGAALVVAVPAALGAYALQRWVLAPVVGGLAAGYADLEPAVGSGAAVVAAAGLLALALLAAAWTARRVVSEPPVAGLREE
jgi:ABC-type lipoprotein release transport system permease subunit